MRFLGDIVRRMQGHHQKKAPLSRKLNDTARRERGPHRSSRPSKSKQAVPHT
jgi:hypothetical protein